MSKSVWTSGFWKPLVHKNMSNFWNNIFHKFSGGKAQAIGFLKLLRSQDIIAMALFLQDILTVLHKASLKFQKHGSIVAEVSSCINTAIKTLQRFNNTDGPLLKKLPKFQTSSAPSAGATTRQTYKLTCGSGILPKREMFLLKHCVLL